MMKKIRRCTSCGGYTLAAEHCGAASVLAHPQRFDLNDRYGEYRRRWKGV